MVLPDLNRYNTEYDTEYNTEIARFERELSEIEAKYSGIGYPFCVLEMHRATLTHDVNMAKIRGDMASVGKVATDIIFASPIVFTLCAAGTIIVAPIAPIVFAWRYYLKCKSRKHKNFPGSEPLL